MNREKAKAKFMRGAEEMLRRCGIGGEEHPEASFDEIAGKLSQERRELMGEMLGEMLLQHGDGRYEEVECPQCGQKTNSNGRRTRTVLHAEGQVEVKRTHRLCPNVGRGFSPLDRRLQLIEQRSWSPGTIGQALRLCSEIPFARAAKQFEELTHVPLSKNSLQRLAQTYGGRLVAEQACEAQAMVQIPSKEREVVWRERVEPVSEVMNISMDGAMVNIREEGWKEVKLVAVSAVRHQRDAETGSVVAHLSDHSYRAGLWDATEFGKQQWAEACRRGVDNASYLSSVNDGAAWIWNIVRMSYGNCVEIIDWWHAVEKLWLIAQHRFNTESDEATNWVCARNNT